MKQNVVRLDGNSRDDLEIKTNADTAHALERGLCQKTIVVGFAVPKPTAVAVESDAGDEGKVYAFERKKRWICGFENQTSRDGVLLGQGNEKPAMSLAEWTGAREFSPTATAL